MTEARDRSYVPHTHREVVPGCFRCELSADEVVECEHPVMLSADIYPPIVYCTRCGEILQDG